jgi:chemotaxis protein histidine kinase CheA
MEEIKRQVSRARWRLILQQFLGIVTWSLFATMLAAVVALAVPKIWVLNVDKQIWNWSWIGGALAAGFLLAVIWTYFVRRGALEAAIEIDRRFGLKERVSSTLALGPQELDTEAGQALLDDAVRRVSRIEVNERFGVSLNWRALLPLLPAIAVFALMLAVPDALPRQESLANETELATKEQIKKVNEELKRKIAEQQKKAEESGLKDAEVLFKELHRELDKLTGKDDLDRKNALIKLNDLAKDLEKRRDQLGGADEMRKQLNQMKNIERGPADKVAKAIKDGDFKQALEELKKLQEELKDGDMNEEQQKQLAQQLDQMQKKMEQMVQAHEQAKRDLEQEIKKKMEAGDLAEAGKMQQKLDQLNQQNPQMQRMQQMANKMGQCSQALQQGDNKQAGQQLGDLAADLQQMQQEMAELESLDDVMNQIAQAKNAMNCKECQGGGCEACMGNGFNQGFGQGQGQQPGFGLGEGQGQGDRPEERTDTSYYESQVRGKPRPGEAVRTGDADGPNVAGVSRETVKAEIQNAVSKDPDPLVDQQLPRAQREQAKQYFERFRKGE